MNGADNLLKSLWDGGIRVCFANPGTSEMHLVAALDRQPEMRAVLGLFEGVCTGAADGYGRMLDKPAATLLHLGPGLANGLSNLHNAMRAQSPIVNIVGDHAGTHRSLDAPLTSDIEGTARPFSNWVRTSQSAQELFPDAAAAVAAARRAPGHVATLIVPADVTWERIDSHERAPAKTLTGHGRKPRLSNIEAAAEALSGKLDSCAIILNGRALREDTLEIAGQIAAATGARLLFPTHAARISRGAGRVEAERIPYVIDHATAALAQFRTLILVGAKAPVAFFGYPDRQGRLTRPDTRILELASIDEDLDAAISALAELIVTGKRETRRAELELPQRPTGAITRDKLGVLLASVIPENSIVVDESITTGRNFLSATRTARPHDWLMGTGGSIGYGLPCAVGAAIACPERRVIALESDGSGMYMPQALWTMARESLDVLTLVFANRQYQILRTEFQNMGIPGVSERAAKLLDIDSPTVDWVGLAKALGVPAKRATTMEDVAAAIDVGLSERGPMLLEVVL
jgi:acetolactate synthase-1/2/3 large subunit